MARARNGRFLLRIEDIDRQRSKPEWELQIYDDLAWLGIRWDAAPMRQSDRTSAYEAALDALWKRNLLYPCTCTRRDMAAAASAPQEGGEGLMGPDGLVYPGTCRPKSGISLGQTRRPQGIALRLNMSRAIETVMQLAQNDKTDLQDAVSFQENGTGPLGQTGLIKTGIRRLEDAIGDIVLSRRDFVGSYHLSVVLDDAAQGVTHVVRGRDLFEATPIHVVLQKLMGLPSLEYHHHALIRDDHGKRLAKRDDARSIASYRDMGLQPEDIRKRVNLSI